MAYEWTAERIAVLITMWGEGLSASEIGRRLNITKNAVIGKAFRLQLSKRREVAEDQPADPSIIRLDRLGARMCSWPLGESGEDGFHFCGEPTVEGKPYCAAHCKIAYVPVTKSRKTAAVA